MYRQSKTSSTCLHNMVNFGLLTAEICWRVWGTPANFNGFRVLAALLHGTPVVKKKERKSIYIAPFRTKVHTKRSGMDHTVLPANNTMPAFLCGVEQRAPPIFGRAAIRLGIGQHSSCLRHSTMSLCLVAYENLQ